MTDHHPPMLNGELAVCALELDPPVQFLGRNVSVSGNQYSLAFILEN